MPSSQPDPWARLGHDGPADAWPSESAEAAVVGRERELGLLHTAYSEVVERGRAGVVTIVADAGVGKTRLLEELNHWIDGRDDGSVVLRGRSASEARSMPLSGLRSLVADRFEIRSDESGADVAAKLADGLAPLAAGQAEIVGHWLGFDVAHSSAVRDLVGNPEFGTIAFGHLTTHLHGLLANAPLVLLLDDLQWSDPESLDAIGHVVDAFADKPLLVVCSARTSLFDHRPRWSAGPGEATTTIELGPLDDDSRRTHLRSLLHRADSIPDELVELVVDRSAGNPLHARELVGLLVDDGVVVTDRQPWQIDVDRLARCSPPTDLAGVLRARLDALAPAEAAVLRHAAVVGGTFWDDALVAVARASGAGPGTHAGIATSLWRLGGRGWVRAHERSAYTGCREYSFGQTSIREATDASTTTTERRSAHGAAAAWLERRSGDRSGETVAVLAEHLSQAGEFERAADMFHEAGSRSSATGALTTASAFYERSLACRDATGTGGGIAATSTRIELAHLLAGLGRNDEAAETYRAAESTANRSGSHRLATNAMAGALRTAAARGDWDESARLAERVRPLAERFGGEVLARSLSGQALLLVDGPNQDLDVAGQLIARALEIWRTLEDPASELRTINELGLVSSKAGRPSDADRWYEEGLALARRVGDTSGEWMLLQNRAVLAHLEARAGNTDYGRVLDLYRTSHEQRRRLGLPHVLSLANLAQAEIEAGDIENGRHHAAEALRVGWDRHDPLDWTIALIALAQVDLVEGRTDDGLEILGALLAHRRTPSLEREIAAVLDFHDVDRSLADAAMTERAGVDLPALVERLLADSSRPDP